METISLPRKLLVSHEKRQSQMETLSLMCKLSISPGDF